MEWERSGLSSAPRSFGKLGWGGLAGCLESGSLNGFRLYEHLLKQQMPLFISSLWLDGPGEMHRSLAFSTWPPLKLSQGISNFHYHLLKETF